MDNATVSPTFQALTKSTFKALDQVHALKVLHRIDKGVFPLLPALWAIIFNIKTDLEKNSSPTSSTCSKRQHSAWNHSVYLRQCLDDGVYVTTI